MVLAYFTQEEWRKLRRHAADAHNLDDTYEAWRASIDRLATKLQAGDSQVVKYYVDVQELIEWCEEQGLPLDTRARSRFVAERAGDNQS